MNAENICLASKTIDIADHENYIELTNRLCYYDAPNLNNVLLPYAGCEEDALRCAETLVNMPLQARYIKKKNMDDLGSHELTFDKDGSANFNTASVGVHTKVWISEPETVTTVQGETKELPCLYATARVWKRHKNVVAAIQRLFSTPQGLNSSWEIATNEFNFSHGIKKLTDYEFLGNTCLGSDITPAYNGTSKTIAMASLEEQNAELLIAEALSQDLQDLESSIDNNEKIKEADILEDNKDLLSSEEVKEEEVSTEEVSEQPTAEVNESANETETPKVESETSETDEEDEKEKENPSDEEPTEKPENDEEDEKKEKAETSESTTESSAMTTNDLIHKLNRAVYEANDDLYVSHVFPEEHKLWARGWRMSELDYIEFSYSVEGDAVTLGEGVEVTLVASPKTINETVAELNQQISEKDDLILKSSEELTALKAEIAELSVFKSQIEEIEREKAEAEITAQREELIASVVKSGMITKEELETSEEMKQMVAELDKKSLMSIVGERLAMSMAEKAETETKPEVETSTAKKTVHVATNLNNDDEVEVSMKDKVASLRKSLRK